MYNLKIKNHCDAYKNNISGLQKTETHSRELFFFLNDVLEAYQKTPQIYWIQDWERRQGKLNTEQGQDSWIKN